MSKSLALYAFEILSKELLGAKPLGLLDFESVTHSKDASYPAQSPLFVTWNSNGELRGCIGTFQAQEIASGLQEFALISALQDLRFDPIQARELPSLSVHVTLLDKFTEIKDPLDWTVGLHGLKVRFIYNSRHYLGTFLPVVAEEQGWDHKETLWNLLRKAGLSGVSMTSSLSMYQTLIGNNAMKLERYDGLKCDATYQEYLDATKS